MEPREELHRTAFGIARDLNDGHAQRAAATLQAEADLSRRMPDGATRMAVLAHDVMQIQREFPRPQAVLREDDVRNQCGERLHALRIDGFDERYGRNIHTEVARIPVGLARDYRELNQITLTPACRTDGSTLRNWRPQPQHDRGYDQYDRRGALPPGGYEQGYPAMGVPVPEQRLRVTRPGDIETGNQALDFLANRIAPGVILDQLRRR